MFIFQKLLWSPSNVGATLLSLVTDILTHIIWGVCVVVQPSLSCTTAYAGHSCMTLTQRSIQMVVLHSEYTICTLCTSKVELSVLELATTVCQVLKQSQSTAGTSVHTTRSFQILSGMLSTFINMSSICHVHECCCHCLRINRTSLPHNNASSLPSKSCFHMQELPFDYDECGTWCQRLEMKSGCYTDWQTLLK